MAVNVKGAFLSAQAAARQMVAQGDGGAIINLTSVNAIVAIPNQTAYTVSKGAIHQLTRSMAVQLARHGIRVNAIGPGVIDTELNAEALRDDPDGFDKLLSRTPLGRAGAPNEIGAVAAFLASDDASYVTGETVYADGGRLALNLTLGPEERGS
jgi:NAD(P)-dependent dehydrogenase (short-subunit alcohol dehydrogenase family)